MKSFALACLVVLATTPSSWSQTASTDDLRKTLDSLNESEKAILRELQEIHKLLAGQQAPRPAADVLPSTPIDISAQPHQGASNARVAVIEYSDYQCPFCGRYDKDTYPKLLKDYVETGKIKYVWRDYPLDFHQHAEKAAEAARCAGEQGKFWQMHDQLFENQQKIAPADLPKYAETLQLDTAKFQQCLDSGRYASDIKKGVDDAATVGISGTPSFVIGTIEPNGTVKPVKKLVGARSYAEFKTAIDSLLQ